MGSSELRSAVLAQASNSPDSHDPFLLLLAECRDIELDATDDACRAYGTTNHDCAAHMS